MQILDVGILTRPQLRITVLEFSLENERVDSLQLQVTQRKALTVHFRISGLGY